MAPSESSMSVSCQIKEGEDLTERCALVDMMPVLAHVITGRTTQLCSVRSVDPSIIPVIVVCCMLYVVWVGMVCCMLYVVCCM